MIIPLWAVFGLIAAVLSSAMLLTQEKFRVNGYVLAFWIKAVSVCVTAPFVLLNGAPADPLFYIYLLCTAVIYAISDVIFFNGITKTDAGAVSRLIPAAAVSGFLIWFIIQPDLFAVYAARPVISIGIFLTLCGFALCAFRLKKCNLTRKTVQAIWFVLVAATIGPLFTKLTTFHAEREIGLYSYMFFQSAMMMGLWVLFLAVRKPISMTQFFERKALIQSMMIGGISAAIVLMKLSAFYVVDNPAYIAALITLDSVLILFVYKLWGKKTHADLKAGLGLVLCVAVLIVLRAQI